MIVIRYLALSVVTIGGCVMLIGVFAPWLALWWQPVQTRRKVFKLYGSILVTALIVYLIARTISQNFQN